MREIRFSKKGGLKTFDSKNMESQLQFAQKISKKSLKFAEISSCEIWSKGPKNRVFGPFSSKTKGPLLKWFWIHRWIKRKFPLIKKVCWWNFLDCSELFGNLSLSKSWTQVTVKFNVSLLVFDSRIFSLLPGIVLFCVCVCFFMLSPYTRELLCWRCGEVGDGRRTERSLPLEGHD